MCSKNITTSLLHAGITIATYLAGFPHNESLTTHIPGGRFTGPKPKNCIYTNIINIYIYDVYRFVFFCVGTKTLWMLSRLHSCVVFVICLGALLWCQKVGGCIMSQSMSFRCLVLNMLCQPRFQNVVERDYTPVRAHNRHSGRNFGKMVLRASPTTESHVKPFLFHYQKPLIFNQWLNFFILWG